MYPQQVPWLDGASILGLSTVWRCVTLIADVLADMPWREWSGPEESPTALQPSRIVRRPAQLMSRREWAWRVVATEALFNAVHLLHVGGTDSEGVPWSLLPIPPDAIAPADMPDPWGILPPTSYTIGGRYVSADNVTVVRRAPFPNIRDEALAIINLARREFTTFLAASVHASRYWYAGGPTVTQIVTDQVIDGPAAEEIAKRWMDRRSLGADYPAVLGKGAEAKPWGADPTTESAVEARKEINADIARYFGLPTRTVNAPAGDSETYANVEDDKADLWSFTLRGYAGPVEDAISDHLPGDYITGRRMRLDPNRFLQGNLAARATAYASLVSGERPVLDVDEARSIGFGLGPRTTADPSPDVAGDAIPAAFVAAMSSEVPA